MKNILFIILNLIFVIGCIIGDLIIGFNTHFNVTFYYATLFFIVGISIGNLIFLIVHMLVDPTYKFKKYIPIYHISYLIIAAIMYYVTEWAKDYDKFKMIYWVVLLAALVIDSIVFLIINIKTPLEDKPKFKVNNNQ